MGVVALRIFGWVIPLLLAAVAGLSPAGTIAGPIWTPLVPGSVDEPLHDSIMVQPLALAPLTNPVTQHPSPRALHTLAYLPDSDRAILFGGSTVDTGESNETWVYHFANLTWERLNPPMSPTGRAEHAMAYHEASGVLVLFGGHTREGPSNETWIFNTTTNEWIQRSPSVSPSPRYGHAMAYDPVSRRIILFGGFNIEEDPVTMDQTWAYDLTTDAWTRRFPTLSPPPAYADPMAYDPSSSLIVHVSNGIAAETWTFDPALDTWGQRHPPVQPPPRDFAMLVAHPPTSRVFFHGGELSCLELFQGVVRPPVFDGVEQPCRMEDLWAYDAIRDEWSEMPHGGNPVLSGHAGIYRVASGRLFVVSLGTDCPPRLDWETWTYDPMANEWANAERPGLPSRTLGLHTIGGDRRVDIAWGPPAVYGSSPIHGYRLHWASSFQGWPPVFSTVEVGDVLSYAHTGLSNGAAYVYAVSAMNDEGEGPRSCVAGSFARALPGSPRTVSSSGQMDVVLEWDPPVDDGGFTIDSYVVYRGTSRDRMVPLASVPTEYYRDSNVSVGTTYFYQIAGVTVVGEGPPSEFVTVTPGWILLASAGGGAAAVAVAALAILRRRRRRARSFKPVENEAGPDDNPPL